MQSLACQTTNQGIQGTLAVKENSDILLTAAKTKAQLLQYMKLLVLL